MCGIVGIWDKAGGAIDRGRVERATELLKYRGPDSAGFFVENDIGLGHRRLKIIDLTEGGAQPMASADGRYVLIFNGEIYNYRELGEHSSDTRVLLERLIEEGVDVLKDLRGMFALALWDKKKKELLLARDPFGKKPLYYFDDGSMFAFSSEMKSLLEFVDLKVSREDLVKYFLYEYVPAPGSGFEGVKQVPMGSWLKVSEKGIEIHKWWNPEFLPKIEKKEGEILEELDEKLRVAVERRMVADVPVGILLSGGLDSTTIAWYMRQLKQQELHSFSVSFDEEGFDEGGFAKRAAGALETIHHDVKFSVDDVVPTMKQIVEKMDIPLGDASLLPTYAVSKLAREKVTVVLDGDGSDELFGGYGTFQAAVVAEKLPKWLRNMMMEWLPWVNMLPTNYGYFSFDFKLKSFLKGINYPLAYRNQIWLGSFTDKELEELLMPEWRRYTRGLFDPLELSIEQDTEIIDQVSALTIQQYLHNDILVKLDRATMMHGLEARTPFLDMDLAELAMRLPVEYKKDKVILRKLMWGRIPDEIINRKKQGFSLPLGQWLRGPLYDFACEVLENKKLQESGVINPIVVQRLLREHKAGEVDHRKKLWTLLAWQMWWERWVA